MSRSTLYVIKEITSSFLFISIILTSIAWLSQALRYLDLFTSENVAASDYFFYIILLIPKISNITIPISLFISIIYILNRMREDSELLIYWSAGRSNRNILLKPILIFSSFLFILQLILTIVVIPSSSLELRNKITEIRSGGVDYNILKEKKFISPVKNLTIFIQEIKNERFSGLLIQDDKDQLKPITYIAENGEFKKINNKSYLVLLNGFMQILNKENGKISEIQFEFYELDLTPYYEKGKKDIYPDEMSSKDLIKKIVNNKNDSEEFAVFQNRLINPIYIFVLAILPLITFKIVRKPDSKWTLPIIFISMVALFIKFFEVTMSSMLVTKNELVYFNYLFPIVLIITVLIILYSEKNVYQRLRSFI
ncbi:MAG: LptF/LptG family permease [Pelagibacterales bacterium]|nr:LptF/LptG family permease [Pelagibacterales bacterium]